LALSELRLGLHLLSGLRLRLLGLLGFLIYLERRGGSPALASSTLFEQLLFLRLPKGDCELLSLDQGVVLAWSHKLMLVHHGGRGGE
jgi:hypothetical protein